MFVFHPKTYLLKMLFKSVAVYNLFDLHSFISDHILTKVGDFGSCCHHDFIVTIHEYSPISSPVLYLIVLSSHLLSLNHCICWLKQIGNIKKTRIVLIVLNWNVQTCYDHTFISTFLYSYKNIEETLSKLN